VDIAKGYNRPNRRALSTSTYEIVNELLMDLTIEPGARINMDQLARDLQVSNTPLREALSRLEAKGLVTRRDLHGYSASPLLDDRQLGDLFALRTLLEPEAARRAAKQGPGEPLIAELRETVVEMQRLSEEPTLDEQYHKYRAFAEADARFHQAISAASGNGLLHATLVGLNPHVHNYRLSFKTVMAPDTVHEHLEVLEAIAGRKSGEAASAMRRHLRTAHGRLQRTLEGDD
jgi:DNA-binding GntR family transcriptional regulator